MSTTVELSVERLSGVLGGVARERGDPNSVRVCGGRHADVCARGHDPGGADAEVQRKKGGLRAERAVPVRERSAYSHCRTWLRPER